MQTSLPGRNTGRAALHLHEGHFYAPSQPADQFAQTGWSVGSAAALLGMRARSSSGREASPSSELAVLKQAAPAPFSARRPAGEAGAHLTQPGKEMQQASAEGYVQATPHSTIEQSFQASHAAHSSRHSSSASLRAGPGSLLGAEGSYSRHSSAPVSPMHASGKADSSRQSSEGQGQSRLQSSSGQQSSAVHTMPGSLGTFARGDKSSVMRPGSGGGLHSQLRGSSSVLHPDEGMQVPQQHPLQGQWGLGSASEVDQHNFAVERSYSPSSSNGSALSAHDEDNVPFAGEDSHILSEWGQEPDRNFYNHGSDLLPQHFPFGQQLNSHQSNSLTSGNAQGYAGSLPGASRVSSADLQPERQQGSAQLEGTLGSRQVGEAQIGAKEDACHLGYSGSSWAHDGGMPAGQPVWPRTGGPGAEGPSVTGPWNETLGQRDSGMVDSRAAGLSTHLHSSLDLGGWYEAEHSEE